MREPQQPIRLAILAPIRLHRPCRLWRTFLQHWAARDSILAR